MARTLGTVHTHQTVEQSRAKTRYENKKHR